MEGNRQPEIIKGITRGNTIELELPVSLPDGSPVLVSIEPIPASEEERRRMIFSLSGAWKNDSSLPGIFEEIAQERGKSKGREVRLG